MSALQESPLFHRLWTRAVGTPGYSKADWTELSRLEVAAPGPTVEEPEVERVAREIRGAWVEWATRQPNPKPSWLVPWDRCDEQTKDADRYLALRVLVPAIARLRPLSPGDPERVAIWERGDHHGITCAAKVVEEILEGKHPDPLHPFTNLTLERMRTRLVEACAERDRIKALLAKNEGRVKEIVDDALVSRIERLEGLLRETTAHIPRTEGDETTGDERNLDDNIALLNRIEAAVPGIFS